MARLIAVLIILSLAATASAEVRKKKKKKRKKSRPNTTQVQGDKAVADAMKYCNEIMENARVKYQDEKLSASLCEKVKNQVAEQELGGQQAPEGAMGVAMMMAQKCVGKMGFDMSSLLGGVGGGGGGSGGSEAGTTGVKAKAAEAMSKAKEMMLNFAAGAKEAYDKGSE